MIKFNDDEVKELIELGELPDSVRNNMDQDSDSGDEKREDNKEEEDLDIDKVILI